jgi:hypothetical protein
MTAPQLQQAVQWHQDLIRTLRDRQFQAAIAALLGILIYQFAGVHISTTAIQLWVGALVAFMLGSGIAQHGHARAAGSLGLAGSQASAIDAIADMAQHLTSAAVGPAVPVGPFTPPPPTDGPGPDPGAPNAGQ